MRIVLMGPPGAGKGTQAKKLVEALGMRHLSSGDILRARRAGNSPLAKELADYMDAGKLVPDDVVVKVMAAELSANSGGGLLLDGFPRTVVQAEALDDELAKTGNALDAVVVMDAQEKVILKRITGRRSCPKCGTVYHVVNMPPKKDMVCDKCGTALVHREDDKADVFRKRLEAYRGQTQPVIDYYRGRAGMAVIDVDGGRDADAVLAELVAKLKAARPAR